MKKSLLAFILTGAYATIINAQITITQNDVAGIGKVCLQAHDTLIPKTSGVVNPGPAGANQTWSFSTLTVGTLDTLLFTNPNWTPAGNSFPGANLAMKNSTDSSIAYLSNSTSGLFILGIYADLTGNGTFSVFHENPTQEINSFPDTYNSTFSNTSKINFAMPYTGQPGIDSIRVKQTVIKNIKSDGWGSLTTPLGTFSTIRSSGPIVTIDTILAHIQANNLWISVSTTNDTVTHFSWWANNVGFALLDFDSTKADTIKNITWLKATPTNNAVNELSLNHIAVIYPNPATSYIDFEIKSTDASSIGIFNITGERMATIPVNRKNQVAYNVESLDPGVYFYNILNSAGTQIDAGKITLVR